jgi:hypothetical protein
MVIQEMIGRDGMEQESSRVVQVIRRIRRVVENRETEKRENGKRKIPRRTKKNQKYSSIVTGKEIEMRYVAAKRLERLSLSVCQCSDQWLPKRGKEREKHFEWLRPMEQNKAAV